MKGMKASKNKERAKFIITDWATANLSVFCFNIFRCLNSSPEVDIDYVINYITAPKLCLEQLIIPFALLFIYWLSGFYNNPFGKSRFYELLNTALISGITTILIHLSLLTNDQMNDIEANLLQILSIFLIFFTLTIAGRLIVINGQIRKFKSRRWKCNSVVVGNSRKAHQLAEQLINSKAVIGNEIEGFFRIEGEKDFTSDAWDMKDIAEICKNKEIDQVIIAPEKSDEKSVLNIVYQLFPLGLPLKLTPDTLSFMTSSIQLKDIYGQPLVDLTHSNMGDGAKNLKRTLDVLISFIVLVVFFPIYLILGIWVKIDSKGPVFYRQERIGLRQKPFKILKFRTMRTDAEANGPQLSSDHDKRVTRSGRIFRKYRLDELPQFFNVLKGDMSIVGPRPEREYYIRQIVKKAPYYTLLYQTRPGITSWGMVQYGYASNVEEMVERSKYDLIYISNMSILVDMKIILYTVLTIIEGKGK